MLKGSLIAQELGALRGQLQGALEAGGEDLLARAPDSVRRLFAGE